MYLLGYDIGSSSVKASLVNAETGKCVSSAFFPKTEAAIMAARPGWAEQDPQNWWENLKLSTQAVMAGSLSLIHISLRPCPPTAQSRRHDKGFRQILHQS